MIAGACAAARAQGLAPGMAVAQAQAMVPGLKVVDADPAGDAAGLERLAAWCLRYAPVAAADPPDGIVIDVAGAAHLMGGEAALLEDLVRRLAAAGFAARAALADTLGGELGSRPLRAGGDDRSPGQRPRRPRIPACRRPAARRRDGRGPAPPRLRHGGRAHGGTPAVLGAALRPGARPPARPGPRGGARADRTRPPARDPAGPARLRRAAAACGRPAPRLAQARASALRRPRGEGPERAPARPPASTASAGPPPPCASARRSGTRDPAHLVRLFGEKLGTVDPGFGIEAASLAATRTEPFAARQLAVRDADAPPEAELGPLVDRIASRIGPRRLYRVAPVESDLPERAERRVAALSPPSGTSWHDGPRPALVLDPPEPVKVMALLPDHPPRLFVWRGRRMPIVRVDGPERVHGEWWRDDAETWLIRDYFRVEGEDGARYWLFRTGEANGPARWFLHGAFG